MNLVRWVKGLGLTPRVMGNVKGLQDPYRNPTTQQGWAERWGQNAAMVTSFADGSKISFEQSIVANATGFKVRQRGMSRGLEFDGSIMDIHQLYDLDELRELGGVVDYTVGPPLSQGLLPRRAPGPQAAPLPQPLQDGRGPAVPVLGAVPPGALRGADLHRSGGALRRRGRRRRSAGPVVEVCAVAKRDLQAGEVLDEYGMYMTYGEAVNVEEMSAGATCPKGSSRAAGSAATIPKDQVLTYDDVELPEGRVADSAARRAVPPLPR